MFRRSRMNDGKRDPCPRTLRSKSPYLQIRRLTKKFGEFTALADISLDVFDGEFVCFLGPSGCGKTTLLRAIAGLDIQSDRALIEQAGARTSRRCPPSERDFGIVFQSYALFPNMTVTRNVAYGLESQKTVAGGDPGPGARAARPRGSSRPGRQVPFAALGRAAAAHRARPGHRHVARSAAARRAPVGPRCEGARAPAPRGQGPAAPAGRHHDHGHPRPGRGADHGGPHRGDEPRCHRAGGIARPRSIGSLPACSSPTSSAP